MNIEQCKSFELLCAFRLPDIIIMLSVFDFWCVRRERNCKLHKLDEILGKCFIFLII
jgi:hypothetical protein